MSKCEAINQFKSVYFFGGDLYIKIYDDQRHKLLNKNNNLKSFVVVDITSNVIYNIDQFLSLFYTEEQIKKNDYNAKEIIDMTLDSLKYKVFKKIKKLKEVI